MAATSCSLGSRASSRPSRAMRNTRWTTSAGRHSPTGSGPHRNGSASRRSDLWPQIQEARRLFETYGDEIAAAVLLAGLPELYATQWGAPVLVAHGDLVWHVQRRVRQTAQFLLDVLSREESDAADLTEGTERPGVRPPRFGSSTTG